jgi:hypothetical protein
MSLLKLGRYEKEHTSGKSDVDSTALAAALNMQRSRGDIQPDGDAEYQAGNDHRHISGQDETC